MQALTQDPERIEWLSIAKGWGFVLVTAALLYFTLRRQLRRLEYEGKERMRAVDALRESEARQRLFVEHAPAALAMFDREMRYLAVSRRWLTMYAVENRPVIGVSHYSLFPEIPERWKQIHQRGLAGEVVTAEADPFERADGRIQWLRWEVRPWFEAHGAVGGIVAFSEDITERVVGEQALNESQERYRLLAENVGDVVWVIDVATLRLLYISASVERQRGYTAAEVMVAPVFAGMAPESVQAIEASFPGRVAAFKAGDPAAVTQKREIRQVRRDGTWIWLEMVTTLVRAPGGELRLVGVSRDIDERKRMELRLLDSEERFRAALAAAPVGIYIEIDGRFTYLNAAALKLFGASEEDELLGHPVLQRFHAADHEWVRRRVRVLHEQNQPVPLATEHLLRCDGGVVEAEVAAVPFRGDEKGGALVFAYDVTEQNHAREQLRVHETVLRETGEIAKVGGWSFDAATGAGFWTDEVARIHDLDPAETTSMERGISFYAGESQGKIRTALRAAVEEVRGYDLVLEMVSAKGRHKWVRTIGHPVVENGKVVRVRGAFQDVTELVEATAALRESEGRFRELAEAINEVFWVTTPERKQLLYLSPAFERIWGVPCAAVYTNPERWTDSLHPDDRDRILAAMAAKQVAGEYNEIYRIVRPDGEVRWVQDRAFPVRDTNGAVVRIVGATEDITDKKRIETQFLRAQRLEAIGALAGGVAHDLNNILTPVLMAAGVLKADTEQPRDLELLAMIEQSARRGADIIRQLLAFSRGMEGERIVLQPRHLVREMAAIVRETFPREIELRVEVAADLWAIEANSTQMHQVLMNLCVNARDAMPRGGRLTLGGSNREVADDGLPGAPELKPGPYVVLGVADTGEGMPPETVARIFEPFFTTKALGKGTGLGLSTVLGIVRSHGGHVAVYSEPGVGSQFRVYLPARPEAAAMTSASSDEPPRGNGELILVVDDEPRVRDATLRVLENGGYRALLAANGEEGLRMAETEGAAVRLVITDVMMPVMDGVALARALRALAPKVPVLATTGLENEAKRQELLAAGVGETIAKPCSSRELLVAVARLLAQRP